MYDKRITLLCGHYGSGKTNIAVNMAYRMKELFDRTAVADLDIVNPYFRTLDSRDDFEQRGIRLICSRYANSNVDIPALPPEMYSVVDDPSTHFILDIGGDDRGAYALGRLRDGILEENDYEMLCVINAYRPLTPDAESTIEVMREIESVSGIPFTGIINNSNLGEETTIQTVLDSLEYAVETAEAANIPILATSVKENLTDELRAFCEANPDKQVQIGEILSMKLQKKPV